MGASSSDLCGPPSAVSSALDELPLRSVSDTDWGFRQARLQALSALLRQHPGDVFLHRARIAAVRPVWGWGGAVSDPDWDGVSARYEADHEKNPDDARLAYLYALTLEGRRTAEAIRVLEHALAK